MELFNSDLAQRLIALGELGLLRRLRRVDSRQGVRIRIGGKKLLNFSSNDYLGLCNHSVLKEAAIRAVEKYGAGAGASRLICGSLKVHHELDERLAWFKGTQAALSFASGYAAAVGVICAVMGKEDVLILDKLVHASIIDAARLSGAQLQIFAHNDIEELESILRSTGRSLRVGSDSAKASTLPNKRSSLRNGSRAKKREGLSPKASVGLSSKRPRRLIVTESIFSMDGDRAPLREIVALKEKYGAWLMVDEAHATGLFGPNHRGVADELGVSEQIEVQMGTLGKALGAAGGYICGAEELIQLVINRARPFIFSTAPVPAGAAAAIAGIQIVQSSEGDSLRASLQIRLKQLCAGLGAKSSPEHSYILPLLVGDENQTMATAETLLRNGIFVPGIRYPTVPRNQARLRVTLSAGHSRTDVNRLLGVLNKMNLAKCAGSNFAPPGKQLPSMHDGTVPVR